MTDSELLQLTFTDADPLVGDHRKDGRALLPAAVQIELALVATGGTALRDVSFRRPVVLPHGGSATVRLAGSGAAPGTVRLHADGVAGPVGTATPAGTVAAPAAAAPPAVDGTAWDPERVYAAWSGAGLEYGPSFRTLSSVVVGDGAAEAVLRSEDRRPWIGHPLLLDGVLQLSALVLQGATAPDDVRPLYPVGVDRVVVHTPLRGPEVTVRARCPEQAGDGTGRCDAVVVDRTGRVVAELLGLRMRAAVAATVPSQPAAVPEPAPAPMRALRWVPSATAPAPAPGGRWVVLHPGTPGCAGASAADALRSAGSRVEEVTTGVPDDDGLARLWGDPAADDRPDGVVLATATGDPTGDKERDLLDTLRVVRSLTARRRPGLRLVVLTEGAAAAAPGDRPDPARASVWGLLRTAAIEYPGLSLRMVDTAPGGVVTAPDLGAGPAEGAIRGDARLSPVWEPLPAGPGTRLPVRPDGAYLVLGGHGGLGLAVAERFARDGAGEIHLVSRSGGSRLDPSATAPITAHGALVRSHAIDVGVPGALAALVADLGGRPLRGVVHAAGVLRDGLLRSVSAEDLRAVVAPKADGLRELVAAVAGTELDLAVLFASVSGAFGNLGQAGYAAANAHLDAAAHRLGVPWTSIDWGLWGEIGMGVEVADRLRRRGVHPLGTTEGLDALTAAVLSGERQVVVAHPDREPGSPEPVPATAPPPARTAPVRTAPPSGAGPADPLTAEVTAALVARLGAEDLAADTAFAEFGMDSITSVELSESLGRRWDVALPPTLFLEHPDVRGVVAALRDRHGVDPAGGEPGPVPAPAPVPATAAAAPAAGAPVPREVPDGAIAVVAVSGDLPGADDLDGLWAILRRGDTAFGPVPPERFDVGEVLQDRDTATTGTYCGTGAFVHDIDRLDPRFFELAVREVAEMDPQQKLLLEHAWSVVQEGGAADRRDVGVFVGATYTHHRDAAGLDRVGPHTALGSMNALLANRISYALDLTGPSLTVDTLCSSSLVALEQAVSALRAGRCGTAVVAACHVGLTSWYYRSLSRLGALSADLPRPFDAAADGFVPGEGAVAVLLRPLADALRDGDHVHGVIRGVATNHGGRAGALSVPRSAAQADVLRAALADAGVDASSVDLVETHGTATPLGDPIEIAALAEVFGPGRATPVLLGALKGNIGHLEPASGLASLVKVLLCLRHGEIPPVAGHRGTGGRLRLPEGVLAIPAAPTGWAPGDRPRRAGISAFGMGGTNAHVVVEDWPEATGAGHDPGAAGVLHLSAHTPQALDRRIADLLSVVRAGADPGVLYTAAGQGRRHLALRVAVVARGADELADGLLRAAARGAGTVVHPDDTDDTVAGLAGAARTWVAGGPRGPLGPGAADRRAPLPPYPFRTPRPQPSTVAPDAAGAAALIVGHEVFGRPTVPAALLLCLGLDRAPVLREVSFPARGTGTTRPEHDLDDLADGAVATLHQDGRVIARLRPEPGPVRPSAPDDTPCPRELDPAGLYAWFDTHGTRYAPALRRIGGIRHGAGAVTAELLPGDGSAADRVTAVDAALQAMAVLTLGDPALSDTALLPVGIARVVATGDPADAVSVRLRSRGWHDGTHVADAWLLGADGPVLALEGIRFRPVAGTGGPSRPADAPDTAPGSSLTAARLLEILRGVLADPSVTATTPLSSVGMDSMLAGEVAAELGAAGGAPVSPVEVLAARDGRALAVALGLPDGPPSSGDTPSGHTASGDTPSGDTAGAGHEAPPVADAALVEAVEEAVAPAVAARRTFPDRPTGDRHDVAVIGLAGVLPGADDIDGLWPLLRDGRDALRPAPSERWDRHDRPLGGFVDGIAGFDAGLFELHPRQARLLDPQARWLLRTVWQAWESAGVDPTAAPRRTGVFVGASYQHYREYNVDRELDAAAGLGNHNAFLANRVSWFFDLHGPSLTVDTLCSSSLVALHTAVRSLRDGECDHAVVAGVRLALSPLHYTAMGNLGALSPSGSARAFDDDADGFVPGEGVVTVVLKPLRDALADGDPVHGVITGTAVNHGGRTSGLTVPSVAGQQEVVTAALHDAGVSPDTIGYLEAHGTGTALGDPVEIDALTRAWTPHTTRRQYCAIGSVKTNIGHLEPAAGLAGLAKILLALRHDTLPPTRNLHRPNDRIHFEHTPFHPVLTPTPWHRNGTPRRAALSAFGMGGVNAHVIVEEPPAGGPRTPIPAREHALRISAATEEGVRRLARAYADRIDAAGDDTELADVVHTANTGRAELTRRAAVAGRSAAELRTGLLAVASGAAPVVRGGAAAPAAAPAGPDDLVAAALAGADGLDWAAFSAPTARRTTVPGYPFADEAHWNTTGDRPRDPAPPTVARPVWRAGSTPPGRPPVGLAVLVDGGGPDRRAALLDRLVADGCVPADGLSAADAVVVLDDPGSTTAGFWDRLRGVATGLRTGAVCLWVLHDAAAVGPHEGADLRPWAVARGAAVRAAAAERRWSAATVDIRRDDSDAVEQLPAELYALAAAGPGEPAERALRAGTRLHRDHERLAQQAPRDADASGFHLVVGGHGAVGRELVAALAARGARAVVVVGRSVVEPPAVAGTEVACARADVTDPSGLDAVVARFAERWGPLRGVVHCSGVVNPVGALTRRSSADAERVLAPKTTGSDAVVALARRHGARWVALASSVAGWLPEAGRGVVDYAAANAYQLALAEREDTPALRVTAHAWPDWTGTGMAADPAFAVRHSLTPQQGRAAFAASFDRGGAVVVLGTAAQPTGDAPAPAPASAAPRDPGRAPDPAGPATPGRAAAAAAVSGAFHAVLGEDPGDVAIGSLGLDSITVAELTAAIEARSGRSLDPSVLLRAHTVTDLVAAVGGTAPGPAPAPQTPAPDAAGDLRSLLSDLDDPRTDGKA
ncbi:SDR family NAD(P)-dependent oxidoreductase [Pseudonocardia sp. DR1-2]|uniref:SDR family NAD(P)-dependent oxidoreductase n=1 Tax=Pseudonocardia sp. DR1-2 TaxID=2951168 RepID=UPI002043A8B1|nr:SDR family NAD(P)-dependent oxidoreductase [Pseudonocardia sp. DR1-2]MCM3849798.1 SDR family NAD(P)-dependent oxidoreductase [Pseudonocardia sp. DR1-2]